MRVVIFITFEYFSSHPGGVWILLTPVSVCLCVHVHFFRFKKKKTIHSLQPLSDRCKTLNIGGTPHEEYFIDNSDVIGQMVRYHAHWMKGKGKC